MIDLSQFNFTSAEAAYVVANTPLFIVRNLRNDPAVIRIAGSFQTSDLVSEIADRLGQTPATSRDRIIPFILLGALAVRQDRSAILEVTKLDSSRYRWFKPVTESILATVKPVSRTTIQGIGPVPSATPSSAAANEFQTMELAD